MLREMKYTKILFIAITMLLFAATDLRAQVASSRYTIGDAANNEIADTVDFDLTAPVLTEGDGKLYYIRKINLHGVKYLNHSILKASAGLEEGGSIYLPSKFISNAMQRLWAPRYFSDIQIGATIEGDSLDLEIFLKERPQPRIPLPVAFRPDESRHRNMMHYDHPVTVRNGAERAFREPPQLRFMNSVYHAPRRIAGIFAVRRIRNDVAHFRLRVIRVIVASGRIGRVGDDVAFRPASEKDW